MTAIANPWRPSSVTLLGLLMAPCLIGLAVACSNVQPSSVDATNCLMDAGPDEVDVPGSETVPDATETAPYLSCEGGDALASYDGQNFDSDEGDELIVAEADEVRVDELIDEIIEPGGDDGTDMPPELLGELFIGRLAQLGHGIGGAVVVHRQDPCG